MGLLFGSGKAKRLVRCPYCGGAQWEAAGVISTICRGCRKYIPLEATGRSKSAARPRPTRPVRCLHCGCEQKVYEDAISTTCGLCGRHLDVGSYLIRGRFGKKICTQGDVFFAKGSLYVGSELMGRRVFVGGDLRTGVRALEVIEIQEGGRIRGPLQAPVVRVAPRADSSVRGIISKELKVAGTLIVEGKVSAQRIEVEKGGILEAKEVITVALRVAPGAGFHSTLLVLSEAPELQDLAALDLATGQWHGSKA